MAKAAAILLDFKINSAWDRGVVRGIAEFAREHDWNVVVVPANVDLRSMVVTWHADVVVSSRGDVAAAVKGIPGLLTLAVGHDLSGSGIPSVCPDDRAAGEMAATYLLRCGLRQTSIFAYTESDFGLARAAGFRERIDAGGGTFFGGGEFVGQRGRPNFCSHEAIAAWLKGLPKPCGVFAMCDDWARPLATYCRDVGLRVPEDIALIGVDNDILICELATPPLSSVAIPWRDMGRVTVQIIADHLAGRPVPAACRRVQPLDVVARRSTDTFLIENAQVAEAVTWIHQNAHRTIGVLDVVKAVGTYRQRLERDFRASLGRTVMEEVRRAHIDLARTLLQTTDLSMPEIAARCGFTNANLLGINFRKEVGQTPRAYRRRYHDNSGGNAGRRAAKENVVVVQVDV